MCIRDSVFPKKIDEINILNASILAMHKCLDKLGIKPEFIIVDGNKFKKYKDIPHKTIVKGDQKHLNIAAASILAKNARDNYMQELHYKFPEYSWLTNKGYPTKTHKKAIIDFGITKFHQIFLSLPLTWRSIDNYNMAQKFVMLKLDPLDLELCDYDNPGDQVEVFDITVNEDYIVDGEPGVSVAVSYTHLTLPTTPYV